MPFDAAESYKLSNLSQLQWQNKGAIPLDAMINDIVIAIGILKDKIKQLDDLISMSPEDRLLLFAVLEQERLRKKEQEDVLKPGAVTGVA